MFNLKNLDLNIKKKDRIEITQEEVDKENGVENINPVELAIPDIYPYLSSAAFQTPHNARVHLKRECI